MTKSPSPARKAKVPQPLRFLLDDWQKKFLDTKGDKILCTGRQVGKSEICGIDAGRYAVVNANKTILMIAPTERQAYALFDKTLTYLLDHHSTMLARGKKRPTKTKINLVNGTVIWCLPVGISGLGIRFLTVHRLYVDEASRIGENVFSAVTPMLLTTGGDSIYLSTPAGREGQFADIVTNKDSAYDSFTRFHTNSENVVRTRKFCPTWTKHQRDKALEHLQRERSRMSALQYAQEYEGELIDELRQFFPTELITARMTLQRGQITPLTPYSLYLGVDVARMGDDESVLLSLAERNGLLYQFDMLITTKTKLTDTVRSIQNADQQYNYKKIYIDTGGLGVGVFDPLLEYPQTKRKVVSIDNASRALDCDKESGRKKKLLKEDLYSNLLVLMEQGKIQLFKDDNLFHSLKSIQCEYTDSGNLKIFGNYTHITEALIRAAWCIKDKSLNIYYHSQ